MTTNENKRGGKPTHIHQFLFLATPKELLIQVANGTINARKLAKAELAARGLNKEGKWMGFNER